MAEILVLTVDGSGNVPPAIAIARELAGRGHTVRVLGHQRQESAFAETGLDFTPYRDAYPWSGQEKRRAYRAAIDFIRLVGDRGVGRDLARAHAERTVDVVLVDGMIPGALRAARVLGIPRATLMHTLAAFFLGVPMELAGRTGGFSPRREWGASQTLVATDRELDPAARNRRADGYLWTGVAEPAPARLATPVSLARAVAPPLVLVSLSSVHIPCQTAMFQRILDGLSDVPVRVIATTGPTIDPALLRVPTNAVVHRYVPHAEVMPHASLVIGHGGHSTTVRALMHGLPMVILPADPRIDQALVGRAVARAGAGMCLPRSAKPAEIRAAALAILGEPEFTKNAADAGRRMRSAEGVKRAADAVENLACASQGQAQFE